MLFALLVPEGEKCTEYDNLQFSIFLSLSDHMFLLLQVPRSVIPQYGWYSDFFTQFLILFYPKPCVMMTVILFWWCSIIVCKMAKQCYQWLVLFAVQQNKKTTMSCVTLTFAIQVRKKQLWLVSHSFCKSHLSFIIMSPNYYFLLKK